MFDDYRLGRLQQQRVAAVDNDFSRRRRLSLCFLVDGIAARARARVHQPSKSALTKTVYLSRNGFID